MALARLMAESQKTREKVWKAQSLLWHNLSPIVVLALLVVESQAARHNIFGGTISVVALAGPADLCSRDLTWERATRGRAWAIRLGIRGPDYSEYGASTSLGLDYTSDESDYSRPTRTSRTLPNSFRPMDADPLFHRFSYETSKYYL